MLIMTKLELSYFMLKMICSAQTFVVSKALRSCSPSEVKVAQTTANKRVKRPDSR